jgi:hypothetical protein
MPALALEGAGADVRAMRILFWPNRTGVGLARGGHGATSPAPLPVTSTLRGIEERLEAVSPNSGNMVHVEAPARMFAVDARQSGYSDWKIGNKEGWERRAERFAHDVSRHYDAVCLSFANVIQAFDNAGGSYPVTWRKVATIVRMLEVPVYVFGVGLQDELPAEASAVPEPLLDMLRALDERAAIFGVRAEATAAWLHRLGMRRAQALGCPSLYLYPRNVMAIRAPRLTRDSRIGTAGRLVASHKERARAQLLYAIGQAFQADYVFQNDIFALLRRVAEEPLFDDATGQVDPVVVSAVTERIFGAPSPFASHYFFRDTNRWRMFAHLRDAYFGDRFHGGVVFLQAGRPAAILQADARVRELTAFFDLPTLRLDEAVGGDLVAQVNRALSEDAIGRFQATYRRRLADFVAVCEAAGLGFADPGAIADALGRPAPPRRARIAAE